MESTASNTDQVDNANGLDKIKDCKTPSRPSSSERASPPPDCAICLGQCRNICFTDSCLHRFCFSCLLTWSKIKAECPLCKQPFKSIIHNVRSNDQYEEYYVQQQSEDLAQMALDAYYDAPRYRYRTTLTLHRHEGLAIQQLLMRYPMMPAIAPAPGPPRRSRQLRHPRHQVLFRQNVYRQGLWASPLPDITDRYRNCNPLFYRQNPAQVHRLVPWLNRELSVLVLHYNPVLTIITNHLNEFHIISSAFQQLLLPFLSGYTDHFLHEFHNFASSPFDMIGYDRAVRYNGSPPVPRQNFVDTVINELSSDAESSNDSDIVEMSLDAGPSGTFPVPFNSVSSGESSTNRRLGNLSDSVITIETISHSDTEDSSDEVVMIGYIKPPHERTPEVVDLVASDSDTVIFEETVNSPIEVVDEANPSTSSTIIATSTLSAATISRASPNTVTSDQPSTSGIVTISMKRKNSRMHIYPDTDSENDSKPETKRIKRTKNKSFRKQRTPPLYTASTECTDRDTDSSTNSYLFNDSESSDSSDYKVKTSKKRLNSQYGQSLASKILKKFKNKKNSSDLSKEEVQEESSDSSLSSDNKYSLTQSSGSTLTISKQKLYKKSKHKKSSKNGDSTIKNTKRKSKSKHAKSTEECHDLHKSTADKVNKDKHKTYSKSKAKNKSDIKSSTKKHMTSVPSTSRGLPNESGESSESFWEVAPKNKLHKSASKSVVTSELHHESMVACEGSSCSSTSLLDLMNQSVLSANNPVLSLHNANVVQSSSNNLLSKIEQFDNIINNKSFSPPLSLSAKIESDEDSLRHSEQ